MKIRDLTPGTRFRYLWLDRTATLLSLGESGARVRFDDDARQVRLEDGRTGETTAFGAPGRPVVVSDYSDVEVL